jgi:hypothetical protein
MSNRVTEAHLEAIVKRINVATGSPLEPYAKLTEENMGARAQIGNYHLSYAYGGVSLHRMSNTSGGVSDVFRCGHIPKRELADRMYAFMDGLDAAQTK